MTRLPDDIEQYLLDGLQIRATYALMQRRLISHSEARTQIGRWLLDDENWPGDHPNPID